MTYPLRLKLNPVWAFFGNADDGPYGDDAWRAGRPKTWLLAVLWWLRNPAHNFTAYVIGVADRHHQYIGPEMDSDGAFCAWVHCGRWRLPFLAWNGHGWYRYIGWRPSGAFGIKFIYRPA